MSDDDAKRRAAELIAAARKLAEEAPAHPRELRELLDAESSIYTPRDCV